MIELIPPVFPLLGAAVFFGLVTVLRSSFYLGFVERPIGTALIWGLCSGDWVSSLAFGIFFELFWLDLICAGTYIPPNPNMPLLLCLFLVCAFSSQGFEVPSPPLVAIVLAIPSAFIGTELEQRHRVRLNAMHEHLVEEQQMNQPVSSREIALSILRLWTLETLLFIALGALLYWCFALLIFLSGDFPGPESLNWTALWLTAALGGVLSLRTKRAVAGLAVSLGILGVLIFH